MKIFFKYLAITIFVLLVVFAGYFFGIKKNNFSDLKNIFTKKQQIDNSFLKTKSANIDQNLFGFHAIGSGIKDTNPIGATTRRLFIEWEEYEPTKGDYQDALFEEKLSKLGEDILNLDTVVTFEPSHSKLGYPGKQTNEQNHEIYGYPQDINAWNAMLVHLQEKTNCNSVNDFSYCKSHPERRIKNWQIGNEWLWQWQGDKNDYVRLLKTSRETILKNDPNAKLVIAAITGVESFAIYDGYIEPDPTNKQEVVISKIKEKGPTVLENSSKNVTEGLPGSASELLEFQAKTELMFTSAVPYYDVLDIHFYTSDPYRIPNALKWAQDKQKNNKKPIWSLEHAGPFEKNITQTELSTQIVQRYALGSLSGLERIYWSSYYPTLGWDQRYLNTAIVDVKKPNEQAKGYEKCTYTADSAPTSVWCLKKPAFYTYKLLTEKFKGMTKISQIGDGKEAYVFELTDGTKKVYVGWSVKGKKSFEINSSKDATITHIITEKNQTEPKVDKATTKNGKINLTLTPEPIFIELN